MEEALVGAVVGTTIKVVLQHLISFPVEEIGLIWNFGKDLQKLKKAIVMIRDFLEDAETKQVTNKAVTRWLMKLEAVAFDVDYVFDELNYQLLRNKAEKKVLLRKNSHMSLQMSFLLPLMLQRTSIYLLSLFVRKMFQVPPLYLLLLIKLPLEFEDRSF